eukprot:TRINITY_DN11825_c0_g1_i1.p1 TRINITY_DN11825_c0_g1~~TRINITY_DN11825_c0_g1_i1.p1  ORF type:complete len:584 (-),score=102.06 TRINITY_DN11825_c0_g1_i1:39-1790(-)
MATTSTTSTSTQSRPLQPLSASLYVGDLAPDVTEQILFERFNSVGPVASIRVCRDAVTRRSLGYAYVNFSKYDDAERCLDTLNNVPLPERPCRIMWSQRDPSFRRSGVGNIFIKNLDPEIGHQQLYDTFSLFGNILSCKVVMDENNRSKGYGFIHFETKESADRAIAKLHGMMMGTKKVYVSKFIPNRERLKSKDSSWTNVYVKNIDPDLQNGDLEKLFDKFGPISSAHVMVNENGQSRGFGFVNFKNHEDAVRSVDYFSKGEVKNKLGKPLWAGRAQKKSEREAELKKRREQSRLEKASKYQGSNLYIKNIEDEVTEERLQKEFSPYGPISSIKIVLDENNVRKGFGFVCFESQEDALRAASELNGRILSGCNKPLYVAQHERKEVRLQKLATQHALRTKGLRPSDISTPGATGAYSVGQLYFTSPQYGSPMMYPQLVRGARWAQPPYPIPPFSIAPMQRKPRVAPTANQRGTRTNKPFAHPVSMENQQQVKQNDAEPPKELDATLAIGEKLHALISRKQPKLAGKITGMLLESLTEPNESGVNMFDEGVLALLQNENVLNERIEEAIAVLNSSKREGSAEN